MPDTIDFHSLRNLWLGSTVVQNILSYFNEVGERTPSETIVDVGELFAFLGQKDAASNRNSVISTLRLLQEKTNVGRFIVGRRGGKSRFESKLPLRQIAQHITGESQSATYDGLSVPREVDNIQAPPNAMFQGQAHKPDGGIQDQDPSRKLIEIKFKVDRDFFVSARIPETMSRSDALKLADFIKALPFNSQEDEIGG